MPTPKVRKTTAAEAALNRQKQEFLRSHGINVKVDGSWGPWLQRLYEALMQKTLGTNNANAAALAIPLGGYALGEALGVGTGVGIGTLSLPSAPAIAASVPAAMILGGPVMAAYDAYHGIARLAPITEELRLANVTASDATRVARPVIPEVYTRPAATPVTRTVTLPATVGARMLAAEEKKDTTQKDSLNERERKLVEEAAAKARAEALAEEQHRQDSINQQSWYNRLKRQIGWNKQSKNTGNLGDQQQGKTFMLNVSRTLWGTLNNHWSDLYIPGNFGRAWLYYNYGPHMAGWVAGKASKWFNEAPGGFEEGYNLSNPTDSTKVVTPPNSRDAVGADSTSTPAQDSVITVTTLPNQSYGDSVPAPMITTDSARLAESMVNGAWMQGH